MTGLLTDRQRMPGSTGRSCVVCDQFVAVGFQPEHACLVHTATSPAELARRFGADVAQLVSAVSPQRGLPIGERHAGVRAQVQRHGGEAGVLFCADMLSKTGE